MPETIRTKVVGVSKRNRQSLIEEEVYEGMDLTLEREPDNDHDPNAIAVLIDSFDDDKSRKIGYISGDLAADLAPLMDDGQDIDCLVLNVTGGEEEKHTLGVNIELSILTQQETKERYARIKEQNNLNSTRPEPNPVPPKRKFPLLLVLSIPIALIGACLILISLIGFTSVPEKISTTDKMGFVMVSGMFFFAGLALFIPLIYSLIKRMVGKKTGAN